ncbi:hypothetical protein VPHD271_0094 [Vibrio phage D271]
MELFPIKRKQLYGGGGYLPPITLRRVVLHL